MPSVLSTAITVVRIAFLLLRDVDGISLVFLRNSITAQ